ncbi:LysR family transcriptional regulator [Candidatus Endowatersipora endosymbiont of Watersipora subatra]|uniref:LysR family transcriptional regulator n=1 Tax=Candidatus Endowatersipora endosymbiont of Watersipora subatra TaxID=3077946 RepID=UPI00312C8A5B
MPMDWDKLRIFYKVAKAGSFTHASDTLNLSQSAISRQISALESEIGVPVFHRHARGLLLTEQGDILFQAVEEMTGKLTKVASKLTDFTGKPKGPLRVTTTVGLGSEWLAIRIHEFIDQYPDIQVELKLDNLELDLGMRQADCAIRLRLPQQLNVIQRKLFTVHFHVFATQSYIDRFGRPESFDDLKNHRIIVWGGAAPHYLDDVNWLLTVGMTPGQSRDPVLKINSILAIKRAVQKGAGIALLPDYSVDDDAELIPVMTDTDVPSFDTYFAYPAEMRHSARLNAFRDFLLEKVKNWHF